MKTETGELAAENARLRKLLRDTKRMLADEILDHRIDVATLEVASEIYHFDPVALKKRAMVRNRPSRDGDGRER